MSIEQQSFLNSSAQLNFSGPEFVFAKFWEVLKKSSGSYFNFRVRGWGKMAPGRARVSAPDRVREGDAKLVR